MEWPNRLAECRTSPSSCSLYCSESGSEVTVVTNGSNYLYILSNKNSQHLATVRFSSNVLCVSALHCDGVDSIAVCCLYNRSVVATPLCNITSSVTKTKGVPNDDIFASLLGSQPSKPTDEELSASSTSGFVNGDEVSTVIAACLGSDWVIQNAVVYNDHLLFYKKSKTTGNVIFTVSRSSSSTHCGGRDIPLFTAPPIYEYTFPPMMNSTSMLSRIEGPVDTPHIRPVMTLIRCKHDQEGRDSTVQLLATPLFTALFGSESRLTNAPTVLLGDHRGHIISCNFTRLGCARKSSASEDRHLVPVYSLEQPVVAIHVLKLPIEGHPDSSISNVIVMVGQRGKVVLCIQENDPRPNFVEFHVPGPILSSVLVPCHSLLYSTMKGVYQICLRHRCMEVLESKQGDGHILIPKSSFNFPERLTHSATYIIEPVTTRDSIDTDTQVLCLSPDGYMAVLHATGRQPSKHTSTTTAKDLKENLIAIQTNSVEIEAVKSKISSINASLIELNSALSLLCSTSTDSEACGTFKCSFEPQYEHLSLSHKKPCIDVNVELRDDSSRPLGAGWSLLIQHHADQPGARNARSEGLVVSSIVVPLAGLSGGVGVKARVDMVAVSGEPLSATLHCSLLYDASGILAALNISAVEFGLTSSSVLTKLCSRHFDTLDFLHSSTERVIDLTYSSSSVSNQLLKNLSQRNPQTSHLLHTIELPVALSTVTHMTDMDSLDVAQVPSAELCSKVLRALLPTVGDNLISVKELDNSGGASEVILSTHNGEAISLKIQCLKTREDEQELKVIVRASSKSTAVEITNCVQNKLHSQAHTPANCGDETSREQALKKLSALQSCHQEASDILYELASVESHRSSRLLPLHSPSDQIDSLQTKTFKLYCKLKELQ